jgi:hypothetical protein
MSEHVRSIYGMKCVSDYAEICRTSWGSALTQPTESNSAKTLTRIYEVHDIHFGSSAFTLKLLREASRFIPKGVTSVDVNLTISRFGGRYRRHGSWEVVISRTCSALQSHSAISSPSSRICKEDIVVNWAVDPVKLLLDTLHSMRLTKFDHQSFDHRRASMFDNTVSSRKKRKTPF